MQDFSRKIVFFNVKPLCCCNITKNQKCSLHWFLIIPEKPYFEPTLGNCCPKNPKTTISSKYVCIFQSLCYCNFRQKNLRSVIKHEKLILGHVLSQNPSARFFTEKSSCSVLSFYAAVTSHKKSDMFHKLGFDYTWKTSFWAHIWGLSPQNSKNKNFLKICFNQILTFMLLPIHAKNQKIKCISLSSFTTTFRSKTWGQDFCLSHFEAFMQLKLHAQWSEKV